MVDKSGRPILTGLIALAVVTVVVGGLLGAAALAGTRVLGLGGEEALSTDATARETLFLPLPSESGAGPRLPPDGRGGSSGRPAATGSDEAEPEAPADAPIELEAEQDAVGSFEEIELFGTYRGGGGATLQVQRRQGDDRWEDFPVDITLDGPRFDTTVQTSRRGVNEWRVVDPDTGDRSNVVEVRVG